MYSSNITRSMKCGVRANLRQRWRVPNSRPCNARPMRRYLSPRPGDGGRAANASGRNVGGGGGGDEGRGGGNSGRRFGVGPNRSLGGAANEHSSHAGDPPTKSRIGGNGANSGMKGVGSNGDDGVGRKNCEDVIGIHRSMLKKEGGVSANFNDSRLGNGDVSKVPNSAEGVARVASATMPEGAEERRCDFVGSSSSRPGKVAGDGCAGDRGSGQEQSCIFRGMVFVVHGTGLQKEEEEKASRIVVK